MERIIPNCARSSNLGTSMDKKAHLLCLQQRSSRECDTLWHVQIPKKLLRQLFHCVAKYKFSTTAQHTPGKLT